MDNIVDSPLSVSAVQQSITNASNALSAASAAQTAAIGAATAAVSAQDVASGASSAASSAQSAAKNAETAAESARQTAEGKQDAFPFDGDGSKFLNDSGEFTTPPSGGAAAAELLFFGVENGAPVATHAEPTEPQTIMAMRSIPANPGVWTDVMPAPFTLSESLHGTEFEFIPDNTFKAVFWARSNLARSGALFRLRATDILTGESLALGTASVDLGNQGILQPIIIQGIYETPSIVLAENIRMTLQVQSPLFEVQMGLFSIPPNEKSYIARLISGAAVPGQPGEPGQDAWTAETANVPDGDRVVQQVVDWFGGTGNKPATGMYKGLGGFVDDISKATNVRGMRGEQGINISAPNLLINGNFDRWERGTIQTLEGYGSVDRFTTRMRNGTTAIVSQQKFMLGQTSVPNNPSYFTRIEVTSGNYSNSECQFYQMIENPLLASNNTYTISFWAKADSNKYVAVEFSWVVNSAFNFVYSEKLSITTQWKKYIVTAKYPIIPNQDILINDRYFATFWLSAGSDHDYRTHGIGNQSGTFDIAQVKLEVGDTATPFVPRHIAEELALCQRYFRWRTTNNINQNDLSPTMRVNPTIGTLIDGLYPYDAEL